MTEWSNIFVGGISLDDAGQQHGGIGGEGV